MCTLSQQYAKYTVFCQVKGSVTCVQANCPDSIPPGKRVSDLCKTLTGSVVTERTITMGLSAFSGLRIPQKLLPLNFFVAASEHFGSGSVFPHLKHSQHDSATDGS